MNSCVVEVEIFETILAAVRCQSKMLSMILMNVRRSPR